MSEPFRGDGVKAVFDAYPDHVRPSMMAIRDCVFTAAEMLNIDDVTECLKWGEPSYVARKGSTVRMDWKIRFPDQCRVYFHCQTNLVDTFRCLYGSDFLYEGNRAIVLPLGQAFPREALVHCIGLSLQYHQRKHLPLLGA